MTIQEEIQKLKAQKNAVILAHYYTRPEVQEAADFVGDSLGLTLEAAKTSASVIVFCGVHFMAETAKMLNPGKTVLLPDIDAGCPMAEMAGAEGLKKLKARHPGAVVVTYVNSTAAVKAESDICCTSSNALKVLDSIPEDKTVIFVPDKHLGSYVAEVSGRKNIILWEGFCPVHQKMDSAKILDLKSSYPEAVFVVHPEAPKSIRDLADFVGSTEQILKYCAQSGSAQIIVGTESGILHQLQKRSPGKKFIPASDDLICPNMKKNNLLKLKAALENGEPQILLDPDLAARSALPIRRMMDLS
jgi:quinolinate synthase